jgi:hypothetical protein
MEQPLDELLNFWGAWFPDADLEGFSDPEVVQEYRRTLSDEERIKVAAQCGEILSQERLPLELIAECAWREFDTQEEAREWLLMIKQGLESPDQDTETPAVGRG